MRTVIPQHRMPLPIKFSISGAHTLKPNNWTFKIKYSDEASPNGLEWDLAIHKAVCLCIRDVQQTKAAGRLADSLFWAKSRHGSCLIGKKTEYGHGLESIQRV